MKIGILTIMLGRYDIFFDGLYNTFNNNFLKNHQKTFYIFTDRKIPHYDNIVTISTEKLGWPYDTLKRFHMFLTMKETLLKEDFLFFINANMFCVQEINDEIIPKEENDFLVGVNHPAFFNTPNDTFTYERNSKSEFYIEFGQGKHYFQGCLNGGSSKEFIAMSEILSNKIDLDLRKNIMPIWHDESALNWYFMRKKPMLLEPSYAYPENWSLPFERKILQLDKQNFGGHHYLRKI